MQKGEWRRELVERLEEDYTILYSYTAILFRLKDVIFDLIIREQPAGITLQRMSRMNMNMNIRCNGRSQGKHC
jgi:hypothetical protein